MSFPVSPGINTREFEVQPVAVVSATTVGGIAGVFNWGPINTPTLIEDQGSLVQEFGKPKNNNFETFFTAHNFLDYSNSLVVSRAANVVGFSNTLIAAFSNTTTAVLINSAVSGVSNAGITTSALVLGTGVPSGVSVTAVSATGTNTTVTLSSGTGNSQNNYLLFTSPNAAFTAVANSSVITDPLALYNVGNNGNYEIKSANFGAYAMYIAKWPGSIGNSLQISVCDSANQFSANIGLTNYFSNAAANATGTGIAFVTGSNTATVTLANTSGANDLVTTALAGLVAGSFTVGDVVMAGNNQTIGVQPLQISSIGSVVTGNTSGTNTGIATFTLQFTSSFNLSANISQTTVQRNWQYYNNVDKTPGQSAYVTQFGNTAANDELHVVITDQDGLFTGVPGSILEVWQHLSRATDALTTEGQTNYYKTVINTNSAYVWWGHDRASALSNTALNIASSINSDPLTIAMVGGADGDTETALNFSVMANAIDTFKSAEDVDVSLLMAGKSVGGTFGEQTINYIYDNVISGRQDCVGFASPPANSVVIAQSAAYGTQAQSVVNWANVVRPSDYLFLDSNYKYMFDKYNSVYRWVPYNGDVAGAAAYTDSVRDPWYSIAGFARGQMKNVVKSAWNPKQADRDFLYQNAVNPIVAFPGQGTVLYGDKTHSGSPGSVFSRINVRRLFIVLRKAISRASRDRLFEFNDEFSRAQFVSMVTPFLRDVKGRRGITDFRVVCDDSNNTDQVINNNQFVGDIYIQPARSVNFIQLNFIAVPNGVDFTEVIGKFGG